MTQKQYYVYILTNQRNTVLYTGVTSTLIVRSTQHKQKVVKSFSSKYNLDKLVYYEIHAHAYEAISREKQLKAGSRKKKISLITSMNPLWRDLYDDLVE